MSQRELLKALSAPPHFDIKERNYAATLRKHCVLRLGRMFHPMARQVQLAERIGMLIRQGYVGRNLATNDFIAHLQDGAERIDQGCLVASTSMNALSTATSLALAGCSGAGKSQTVERTLSLYPQVILHTVPFTVTQIVWMKLDCPTQGSPKQLCINFFAEVDRLAGTNYLQTYGHQSHSVEWMLLRMAQVARLHALGLLVVDELQNLRRTAIGPEALMNFLVLLINTIGIPVAVVGTLGAVPILRRNFRQGRRATGVGSAVWDRMPRGAEWDAFITQLWKFQWTRVETPITDEIREALYDESQGIVDVVVKLFMLVQLRLIAISEVRPSFQEVITEKLIREVARQHLVIVRPMLEALRKNRTEDIEKYDDLAPLQAYLDDLVTEGLSGESAGAPKQPMSPSAESPQASDDVATSLVRALVASGVAKDVAEAVLLDVSASADAGDPLELMTLVMDRLRGSPPKQRKARAPAKAAEEVKPLAVDDLRSIVAEARKVKRSAYDALVDAGVVGVSFLGKVA
jgi:hypothetical protein